jgi:hypothetical protein
MMPYYYAFFAGARCAALLPMLTLSRLAPFSFLMLLTLIDEFRG